MQMGLNARRLLNSDMASEHEILRVLCRSPIPKGDWEHARSLIDDATNWQALFELARVWEVEPVAFSNLCSADCDAIPVAVRKAASKGSQQARALALAGSLGVVEIVQRLEARGISVIVLKGPAVAIAAYGDASLRSFADADLLVPKESISKATQLLKDLGYRPHYRDTDEPTLIAHQHALELSQGGRKVELHWALMSRHLKFDVDVQALWSAARRVECAGSTITVLAPHHLFLFICAHGAKHMWERVRWISDVVQLADRLTVDNVVSINSLSAETHTKRLLTLAVLVAKRILRADAIAFDSLDLESEDAVIPLVEIVDGRINGRPAGMEPIREERRDSEMNALLFWVRSRERLRDRVAILTTLFLSPPKTDDGAVSKWIGRPFGIALRALRYARA
jgi:hypothetical protein